MEEQNKWLVVLLPGKSHGWRSLVGCSPWGREELDMTEQLHFQFSLSCIEEGNGTPLQYSCLENPRDRGAWWAALYGVAQSWTWLRQLSSSSNSSSMEAIYLGVCVLGHFSHVQLSATPWTMASQAPLFMGLSRQEYWSGLPFPSPMIKYEVSEVSEVKLLSPVRLLETPWTVAYLAPLSMGFSRQEYWSGLPFPSPINFVLITYILGPLFSYLWN